MLKEESFIKITLDILYSGAVGLDEAGAKELENIRANLAKKKVTLGKEFDNYVADAADWVGGHCL